MQKITPHLWFDREAREAAAFYASVFGTSEPPRVTTLHDTPSGTVDVVDVELLGQQFTLLSAGPLFKFTPAVSFLVVCETPDEVDRLWRQLAEGGTALMELGSYPFSERYGWTQDRYGLSWQVMFAGDRPITRRMIPTLMFTGDVAGRAEEAIAFWSQVFRNSGLEYAMRYGANEAPDREGTIKHARFRLEGEEFAAMDSAYEHGFGFNEAISFLVHCENQQEIDYYWERLSADPNAEQCGWLKDKFGLSWQIVPTAMDRMMTQGTPEQIARVTTAFLQMKKFDLAKLEEAFAGR
ncbi:MAG TPA: VOC family protein [Thermoanaerobaculia bacterium]|nr:VOC family protein [Thermoanaerobaculia bacterium]